MLKEILKKDEIAAMKARDKAKVSILRLVNADVKAFEVNERQDIPDSEAIKIIEKNIKQLKEALYYAEQLNDEEKIANAFKSENDEQRLKDNIELMNSFSRGGLEILYERFQGLSGKDDEIREAQLELFDDMSGYTNESL